MFHNHLLSINVKNFKFGLRHTTTSRLRFMTTWSMVPSIRFKPAIMELIESCLSTAFYAPLCIIYCWTYSKTTELRFLIMSSIYSDRAHDPHNLKWQPTACDSSDSAETWIKECGTKWKKPCGPEMVQHLSSITLTWWNQQIANCKLQTAVFFASAGGFIMHPWITPQNFPSWFDQHIR